MCKLPWSARCLSLRWNYSDNYNMMDAMPPVLPKIRVVTFCQLQTVNQILDPIRLINKYVEDFQSVNKYMTPQQQWLRKLVYDIYGQAHGIQIDSTLLVCARAASQFRTAWLASTHILSNLGLCQSLTKPDRYRPLIDGRCQCHCRST